MSPQNRKGSANMQSSRYQLFFGGATVEDRYMSKQATSNVMG